MVQSSHQLLTLPPSFFSPIHTTLARLASQNKHYTSTEDTMLADVKRDPVGVSVFRTNKSVVGRDFVTVLNQGTPEFNRDKRLNALVSKLPFEKMLQKLVYDKEFSKDSKDAKRGNYQANFGFASGQSCEKHNPASDKAHYGVSLPALLVGTEDHLDLMALVTDLCKLVGVDWSVTSSTLVRNYLGFLHDLIGDSRIDVALVTFHAVPLNAHGFAPNEFGRVQAHVDKQNPDSPPELEPVVMVNKIVEGPDGRLFWAGIIANQKKSVVDCLRRRIQSRRVCHDSLLYYGTIPKFRRPTTSIPDWCEHGVGDRGLFVSYRGETLTSIVLLSRAAMDKDTFYMSSFPWAMRVFRETVGSDFTLVDGVAICASMLLFCNQEPIVHSLTSGALKSVWHVRGNEPCGALGLLVRLAVERNGGINFGKGNTRRCQPFATSKTLNCDKWNRFIAHVCRDCRRSMQKKIKCTLESYRSKVTEYQMMLSNTRVISLCMQHFTVALAKGGFLVCDGCLSQFAVISPSNSNSAHLKKLYGKDSLTPEKLMQQQTQTSRYMSAVLESPVFVSTGENTECEKTRDRKLHVMAERTDAKGLPKKELSSTSAACDLFYPGQLLQSVQPDGRKYQMWRPMFDTKENRFTAHPLGVMNPAEPCMNLPPGNFDLQDGTLVLTAEPKDTDACYETQYFLERHQVHPQHFFQVKKAFLTPPPPGQSHADYLAMILSSCHQLLYQYVEAIKKGTPFPTRKHCPSELHNQSWNKEGDSLITRAVRAIEHELEGPAPTLEARARLVAKTMAQTKLPCRPTTTPRPTPPAKLPPLRAPPPPALRAPPLDAFPTEFNDRLLTMPLLGDELDSFGEDVAVDAVDAPPTAGKRNWAEATTEQRKSRRVSIHPQVTVRKVPADENHRLARGKRVPNLAPNLEAQVDHLADNNNGGTTNFEPISHRTRSSLPVLRDGPHGVDRVMDWSNENITALGALESVGENIRRVYGGPGFNKFDLWDESFRDLQGSRDLFKDVPLYNNHGLYDEAKNAVNSSRLQCGNSQLPGFLSRCFGFEETYIKDQQLFLCHYTLNPELDDINIVGRCRLCDEVALMLLGEGGEVDEDGQTRSANFWWFRSKELAHRYFMLCMILTMGSSDYYTGLYRRCRRKFEQLVHAALGFEAKNSPKANKLSELLEQEYFVIGFGSQNDEIPPFYVVGNQRMDRASHHRKQLTYRYDFCIAVAHLGFYRKHTLRKQTKASAPGKAMYIRPLRPVQE